MVKYDHLSNWSFRAMTLPILGGRHLHVTSEAPGKMRVVSKIAAECDGDDGVIGYYVTEIPC